MVVAHLIVFSVWLTAAAAVNAPHCRCSEHTLPPSSSPPSSSSSLPPPDPCNGVRCQHGGTCQADGDTFSCLCANGYQGQFCQDGIVLTSCEGVNCNRGECEEDGGVARCVCQYGGTGRFCENDLCLSVSCGFFPNPSTGEQAQCELAFNVEEGADPFRCHCEEVYDGGRFCDQIFCETFGLVLACEGNGDCIESGRRKTNALADLCICDDGFYGDLCRLGPCGDDLCQNGGSCVYILGNFSGCECQDGFEGPSCEIITCFGNSCENGGTCEVEGDEFRCMCSEGFSGEFCEIDLSICFGAKCLNGGTCIGRGEDDVRCLCLDDYSGDRCQFGPCLAGQPATFCQNGGSCLADKKNNFLLGCECAEGFSGAMCEVGPCPDDIVCENGGVCVIVNGEFNSCRCPRGVAGDHCEFNFCAGVRCQHGGTCDREGESFRCLCKDGYEGQFCQDGIVLTSCEGVNCNRGECEEEGGVARCVCQDGTGVFCENDLCLSVTCGLGQRDPQTGQFADCSVLDYVEEGEDPFQCECEEAFPTGRFCDQVFCEAFGFQFECSGNGECTGERETNLLSDVCICNDGFFGDLCIFGPCSNDLCQNGGSCVRVFGVFQGCRCRDGFEGDSCEIATCFGNSCVNGGTCEVEGDEFRCRCAEGFSGEFCEIDLSICFGVTCLNGGTCIGTSNYDAACLCLDDYSGDRCQFGPCLASQPPTFCQNGGSCLDDREKNLLLGCECTEGFTGAMCEVGPCPDDVVCENGGVCVIVNGDFTRCRCPRGVAGDRCEFAPCIGNPCQNGGTCSPVIGDPETFQCGCMSPFFGEFCEMEDSS